MGLWGRGPAARQEAERILLEADCGVAATADIPDPLHRSAARDQAALEPFHAGAYARRLVRD